MLFQRLFGRRQRAEAFEDTLLVGSRRVSLLVVRHPRARRYLLRVRPDGMVRLTLPRGGSLAAAKEFAARHTAWIERQLDRLCSETRPPAAWRLGMEILLLGEPVCIEAATPGWIRFGTELVEVADSQGDLRPAIERHLRTLAVRELPPQVVELAASEGVTVRRVTVRNQRSRWGSCSRRGTVSLNWGLIQAPPFVQTYLCLHEILHLREMNHSGRFWREVERACPDYRTAERWLKEHAKLLR